MLRYQKRSDYKGKIKKDADKFYKELKTLKDQYNALEVPKDSIKIVEKLYEIRALYEKWNDSKLYNEYGGLYCSILEDSNR